SCSLEKQHRAFFSGRGDEGPMEKGGKAVKDGRRRTCGALFHTIGAQKQERAGYLGSLLGPHSKAYQKALRSFFACGGSRPEYAPDQSACFRPPRVSTIATHNGTMSRCTTLVRNAG